jgi:hypothetical protein
VFELGLRAVNTTFSAGAKSTVCANKKYVFHAGFIMMKTGYNLGHELQSIMQLPSIILSKDDATRIIENTRQVCY